VHNCIIHSLHSFERAHAAQDGCAPNVVTYNTLVDVYGKMGNWEKAVDVLDLMKSEARPRILVPVT